VELHRLVVLTDAVRVRELNVVLKACEDAGAMPVVFKGAALAHTHYAASWQRPRCDADVLVAPESRERVFQTLQVMGYRRLALISGDLVMYQAPFARLDHLDVEHALDIHWRIVNPQLISDVLTHDELVARSIMVPVQGYRMRVPSPVDSLLVACIHRIAHHPGDDQPVWLEDIHLLASRLDVSDWTAFVDRATRTSIRSICLDGLQRARERLSTAIPLEVVQALGTDGREASAAFLRQRGPIGRLMLDVRALRPGAAVRLMRQHLLPPVEYMQAKYGVRNRALLPAFYLARATSGVMRWLRAACYVSAAR
jgi:hypothetical protein